MQKVVQYNSYNYLYTCKNKSSLLHASYLICDRESTNHNTVQYGCVIVYSNTGVIVKVIMYVSFLCVNLKVQAKVAIASAILHS